MEENLDYSTSNLEHCSYRYLQQLAKSMSLPSNVKKVHLIEMINAKKCSPESEVTRIVQRIKMQRQQLTQVKKRSRRIVQVDTSDSELESPPITRTPKRPVIARCNPELRQVLMQSQNILQSAKPASDRVLRSYHVMKPVKRYINQMSEAGSQTVDDTHRHTQMSTMHIVRKFKPNILSNSICKEDRQLVPISQMGHMLVKRPRLLSGIYPINKDTMQVQSVGVRNREGKMSKINAFIHKPHTEDKSNQTVFNCKKKKNIQLTVQDIIDGNLEAQVNMQKLNYPNASGVSVPGATELYPNLCDANSEYYHKKIRAEQVRERRMSAVTTRCELPRISDAFGLFNDRQHVTQPLYVQVSEEAERILNYPIFAKRNTCLLETVYNFKTQFLTNQPLLQIATTSATKCVYSTPTVTTPVAQRVPVTCTEPYVASFERDSQYQYSHVDSQINEWKCTDQDYDYRFNGEQNTSNSSLGSAHAPELGANVTISDMVEDALELISQDGDYMERMGMDVRMQCVLCNWAGPKIILEYHIRKEHSGEIDKQEAAEFSVTYRLGALARRALWSCRVLQRRRALYVLSVKHDQPHHFRATLSSLSPDAELTAASITIFNKVTGEPHTWSGEVRELPPNLPYDNEASLKVDLAEMNLLPNRLVNGELVMQSPSKLVFGQELDDLQIILFIKIIS